MERKRISMTSFFNHLFTRYPNKSRRVLEILPGLISWTLILFPVWGALFFPYALAYFILFFDVYWLYKSFSLAIMAYIASNKIRGAEKQNWLEKTKDLKHMDQVSHTLVIPNYKEKYEKLRKTLEVLTKQTFPRKQI